MKALWQKFLSLLRRLFRGEQLFALVWAGMTKETNSTVNNARLQELAFDAARAAAEMGLKGGEAREVALARLKSDLAMIGVELADRLVDTLLQIAYIKFREVEG
jgi:hypothetical protein